MAYNPGSPRTSVIFHQKYTKATMAARPPIKGIKGKITANVYQEV